MYHHSYQQNLVTISTKHYLGPESLRLHTEQWHVICFSLFPAWWFWGSPAEVCLALDSEKKTKAGCIFNLVYISDISISFLVFYIKSYFQRTVWGCADKKIYVSLVYLWTTDTRWRLIVWFFSKFTFLNL